MLGAGTLARALARHVVAADATNQWEDFSRGIAVDLGGLHDAGRLMQVGGGPLSGLHVVKLA